MPIHEHGTQILHELGLTRSQARIYVTIIRLGGLCSVREISNFSAIARQDVYRTIDELHDLGLVEKVIANPMKFQTRPLRESFHLLLQTRKQKTHDLRKEVTKLVASLQEKTEKQMEERKKDQFLIVAEKRANIRLMKKAVESAEKHMVIMASWNDIVQWLSILNEQFSNAAERGVCIRWLTVKKQNAYPHPEKAITALEKHDFFLRVIPNLPKERFGIFDGSRALIAISSKPIMTESPTLWTKNQVLISIMENYFETIWKKAAKGREEKLNLKLVTT